MLEKQKKIKALKKKRSKVSTDSFLGWIRPEKTRNNLSTIYSQLANSTTSCMRVKTRCTDQQICMITWLIGWGWRRGWPASGDLCRGVRGAAGSESSSLAPSALAGDSSAHCVASMGLAQQRTLAAAARLIAGYRCPLDRWLPLDLFFFILKTATVQTIFLRKKPGLLQYVLLSFEKILLNTKKSSSNIEKVHQIRRKKNRIWKKFIDFEENFIEFERKFIKLKKSSSILKKTEKGKKKKKRQKESTTEN